MTTAFSLCRVLRLSHFAVVVAAGWLIGWPGASLNAQTTVYSNTTTYTTASYVNSGTSTPGNTFLVADDIAFAAGSAGQQINSITFSVANFNSFAVTATTTLAFYATNGTNGGPGTLLASFKLNPTSYAPIATGVLYTYSPGGSLFTIPASNTVWAGIYFSSTTATQAQTNSLGQAEYDPPTIGSSQDRIFQSTSPAVDGASNPAGNLLAFGNPRANFAWAFVVPEPSTWTMAVLGVAAMGIIAWRRRVLT